MECDRHDSCFGIGALRVLIVDPVQHSVALANGVRGMQSTTD
jgi:hypothetical protein